MKLEIDLMIADEVKAGLALLSRVSEAQAEERAAANVRAVPVVNISDFAQRTQVPEGEQFYTIDAIPKIKIDPAQLSDGPQQPNLDPAQVFGGTPVADPLLSNTTVPPALVVPSAPTVPTLGAASSVAPVELDAKGLPWDSRIHSSSKNKLANGCWKVARGKVPEYVAQVEAELKSGAPSFPPVAPVAPVVPSFPTVPVVAVPAPPAVTVTPTVASSNADALTFETIMPKISALVSAGKMAPTALMQVCTANGLPNVVALQSQPQFIPLVWAALKAQYPELV